MFRFRDTSVINISIVTNKNVQSHRYVESHVITLFQLAKFYNRRKVSYRLPASSNNIERKMLTPSVASQNYNLTPRTQNRHSSLHTCHSTDCNCFKLGQFYKQMCVSSSKLIIIKQFIVVTGTSLPPILMQFHPFFVSAATSDASYADASRWAVMLASAPDH